MKGLTSKQRKILDFIEDFTEKNSFPPTVYEIAKYMCITPPTAHTHIKTLIKKNFISRTKQARGIFVSPNYSRFRKSPKANAISVPLLENLIDFEKLMKKNEDSHIKEFVSVDASRIQPREQDLIFALRQKNSGMKDEGILAGDIVIFKFVKEPKPHSVVAALAKNETFVRIYNPSSDGKYIELLEAGQKPKSATFAVNDVKICGVFIALLRIIPK